MQGRPWRTTSLALQVVLIALPTVGHGQTSRDSSVRVPEAMTVQSIDGKLIDRLPVDRIDSALVLLPGVTPSRFGGLSLRGSSSQDVLTYLDGVPISPGYRNAIFDLTLAGPTSLRGLLPGPAAYSADLGTNALRRATVLPGPLPARFGNAQGGVVLFESALGPAGVGARGSFESDEPFGNGHGVGVNRFQVDGGAQLTSKLRLFIAGTLQGLQSAETGPGAEKFPVFRPAGIDTTVAVPSALGDPFADTSFVDVSQFAISRGECETFSASVNPDLAANYDLKCDGVRTPSTSSSEYQLLGKMEYQLSSRTRAWISGLASQQQFRSFNYDLLFVPQDQLAARGWSRMLTLGFHHDLTRGARPLTLDLALSLQRDRAITGGLTQASELNTRDGMLFSQLHFAYDFDNFPLDGELVTNIRNNTPGSRRTPLDLSNTSQYDYVDRYRNSPYALGGGPERGGPQGRMTLFRENRTVGIASIGWRADSRQYFQAGAEFTRYSTAGYSSFLTSEAFIDAFIDSPTHTAFYVQDQVTLERFTLTGGVHYQRFHSNAARPFVLDTVSSSPTFGSYSYFPTPNSYGFGGITFNGDPLVKLVDDEARTALSPRVQVEFVPFSRSAIRVGVASQSQMPDLAAVLSGVNTDLRVTNIDQVFGGDLDLEKTTTYEIGFRHQINAALAFDGAYYYKDLESQAAFRLVSLADPARLGEPVDLRLATNLGLATIKGIDARLDVRAGMLGGTLGYSYQKGESGDGIQLTGSHPHSLTGLFSLDVPPDWRRATLLGTVLENVAVYAAFRYTSGTAYTACPAIGGNESVMAGENCASFFAGDFLGARLPSFKQFDLRLTRSFGIGGRQLTAYVDVRNVLNFRNVLNVFAVNGQTSNPAEQANVLAGDSSGYGTEAQANGVYAPNGDINLTFGGAAVAGCGQWVSASQTPAAPNCVYLIRAEERFGNGDHVFTLAEQRNASEAHYEVFRGENNFLGAPRRIRIGLEFRF